MVVAAGAAAAGPIGWLAKDLVGGGARMKAFKLAHDEAVGVYFDFAANPKRYDISVRRDGEIVESFTDVDPMRLDELRSEHFSVTLEDAPEGLAA